MLNIYSRYSAWCAKKNFQTFSWVGAFCWCFFSACEKKRITKSKIITEKLTKKKKEKRKKQNCNQNVLIVFIKTLVFLNNSAIYTCAEMLCWGVQVKCPIKCKKFFFFNFLWRVLVRVGNINKHYFTIIVYWFL